MRKELLLEVAYEKFAEKGYNTSLSEISKGAGIKKQSIYNYFPNKEELLYETIQVEMHNFYATKVSEFKGYSNLKFEIKLKKMFVSICEYFSDIKKIRFWRWILLIESQELFEKSRDLIRQSERTFYRQIFELIKSELGDATTKDEEFWPAVQAFAVMIHGVMDGNLLYHDMFDFHVLIENTWSHYWKGIEKMMDSEK